MGVRSANIAAGTAFAISIAMLAAVAATAQADRIRVTVNGESVAFETTGPREINGHVLVPLRGVMEKLGAYVEWNEEAQTVIANRNDVRIRLPIGSRFARVNGNNIQLDVAAITVAGSAMVPLRFLAETLGASVVWDADRSLVSISTGDTEPTVRRHYRGISLTNAAPTPEVISVTTDMRYGRLHAGDTLHVTMRATPGGRGFMRIRGVIGERKMEETSPGVYEGFYNSNSVNTLEIDPNDILTFVVVGDRATAEAHPKGE